MTGCVQFALDKRAIVQWNFIYILETWNPRVTASRILATVNKITRPSILYFCPQINKKKPQVLPFFCKGGLSFFCTRSLNISSVASGQFCGPLSHTFPRWSGAGGMACWRRFALLNILSACSHESPGFLRCFERHVMPIVKLAQFPTLVYSAWTWASHALGCFTHKCKPCFYQFNLTITQIT